LGTTNTTRTFPSALISDALTVLSANWQDPTGDDTFNTGVRVAASTTINAAILTGVVYSSSTDPADTSHFSGGVHEPAPFARRLGQWRLCYALL